jgi:plastocyanin
VRSSKLIVPALAAALLVPAAAAPGAATKRVTVGDNFFVRDGGVPTVTVNRGDRVTWVWRGDSSHNVKVTRGPSRLGGGSPTQRSGTFSKGMRKRGTYTIVCTVHGARDQSMKLVVR